MTKLNQIIAVANSKKSEAKSSLKNAYQVFQKRELFDGMVRTYYPRDEDGDKYADDVKNVVSNTTKQLNSVKETWSEMMNCVITQDTGNTQSKANIVVDGKVLAQDVPVTTLIFLEKQLTDFKTLINSLPVLNPTQEWGFDDDTAMYRSKPTTVTKTKKVEEPIVLYDATDKHPAQTKLITKDVVVGDWTKIEFSTAVSLNEKETYLRNAKKLQEAVVSAREEANSIEIETKKIGDEIFDFVFRK